MRTKRTFLNFITAFFPTIIIAILGFVKIKYFVDSYGSDMNGLIQLTTQVYSYLTLMELGFGTAIIYKLYKPFANNNHKKISELFVGGKKIYKKIGALIFLGGIVAAIVMPFSIKNLTLSKWMVFLVFALYAFDYLTSYVFLFAHKSLLVADQKNHIVNIVNNSKTISYKIIEIILIIFKVNILFLIILSVIFNIISCLAIIKIVKKEYPWLNKDAKADTSAFSLTKDVFVGKLSKLVYQSTNTILLSLFSGLTLVSVFSAYNYIVTFLSQFIETAMNAPKSSFGNLFSDSNEKNSKKIAVFDEFVSICFLLAIFLTLMMAISINSFIGIWIDKTYVVSSIVGILFALLVWCKVVISPTHLIIDTNGLYKDSKIISIISAAMNLILSLILILILDSKIIAVLIPSILGYLLFTHPLEINLVYKKVFNISPKKYYINYLKVSVLFIVLFIGNVVVINYLKLFSVDSIINWFLCAGVLGILNLIILLVLFYYFSASFKSFIKRIKLFWRKK